MFTFLAAYGFVTFWFFLLILALSMGDEEVSEIERFGTALGMAVIWPMTYVLFIIWDKQERGKN